MTFFLLNSRTEEQRRNRLNSLEESFHSAPIMLLMSPDVWSQIPASAPSASPSLPWHQQYDLFSEDITRTSVLQTSQPVTTATDKILQGMLVNKLFQHQVYRRSRINFNLKFSRQLMMRSLKAIIDILMYHQVYRPPPSPFQSEISAFLPGPIKINAWSLQLNR